MTLNPTKHQPLNSHKPQTLKRRPTLTVRYRCGHLGAALGFVFIRLMDKVLHDPKDPKLWELWYIPYYGSCRILSISRRATRV